MLVGARSPELRSQVRYFMVLRLPPPPLPPSPPIQAAAGYTGALNTPEWRKRPAFLQSFEARRLPLAAVHASVEGLSTPRCRLRFCPAPAQRFPSPHWPVSRAACQPRCGS